MPRLDRRTFLTQSLSAAALVVLPGCTHVGRAESRDDTGAVDLPSGGFIDTNVNLFKWPFRTLPHDRTEALVEMLRQHGAQQAWAGSYEALFHKDIGFVNRRLVEECRSRGDGLLVPFGTVNPMLPGWERELERCDVEYGMPGIRLHPGYHQYTLDHPQFGELLERAAARGLVVQLSLLMEDPRMQHPLVQVPVVDLAPLPGLLEELPGLRIVILNNRSNVPRQLLRRLADTGQVYVDMARAEGVGAVSRLLENVPGDRVLFGSHAPYFYYVSALLKMKESDLTEDEAEAIFRGNARQLIDSV